MNFRNLALSGALVAMVALAVVGCNENPIVSGTDAPTNLQAVSINASTVALSWTASTTTGATYNVSWTGKTSGEVGTTTATGTATNIQNLKPEAYEFVVKAVSGGEESAAATVTWAAASRYTSDAANTSTTIRIYEFASVKGSGLVLDPTPPNNGPRNISVKVGADPSKVQLAMFVDTAAGANTFSIGPAYAFPEYRNVDKFDNTVEISDSTYVAAGLSAWYMSRSLDKFFTKADRNLSTFSLPNTVSGADAAKGQGFVIRLKGTDGNTHYARVFVNNHSGNLLQGSGKERYVELEISYQSVANLAYAKGSHIVDSPAGYASHRMY